MCQTNNYQANSPDIKSIKQINNPNSQEIKNTFYITNSNNKASQFSNTNELNFFGQNLNSFFNANTLYSNSSNFNINALNQFENISHFSDKQNNLNSNYQTTSEKLPENKEEKNKK